jgi:hypothetical protein
MKPEQVAYRFVPCDEAGRPREQYTTITSEHLSVGTRIDAALFGYKTWGVVQMLNDHRPLLDARDKFANDLPLAGTLICRAIS